MIFVRTILLCYEKEFILTPGHQGRILDPTFQLLRVEFSKGILLFQNEFYWALSKLHQMTLPYLNGELVFQEYQFI